MSNSFLSEVYRPAPSNLETEHESLFKRSAKFVLNKPEIRSLKNVFIFWQGQIFRNGLILTESLATPIFLKKYNQKFFLICLLKAFLKRNLHFFFKQQFLIVHDEWSFNYFHWLTDTLTRIFLVKDSLSTSVLILPDTFCLSYHTFVLKKFGINFIQNTNDKKILFVSKVLLPKHTAPAGNFNPTILRNAVEFLTNDNNNNKLFMGERIYISRQNSSIRYILNEIDVINCLKTKGFAILNIEDFNFEDQMSILSKAKYLISIHGAGLTNLMFMPEGGSVLELRKKGGSEIYNCYFNLAAVFNHRFYYQPCESDSDDSVQVANIFVDIDKLNKNLVLMGV